MADTAVVFNILAKDHASGVMRGIGGAASHMLSAFGVGLGIGLIDKLGEATSAAINFGLKGAAALEQNQIAFTNLMGSAEQAKAFLADMQKFAAATPFEFADVTAASQKLLAMGFAGNQIKPVLTAVGDAVAGIGGGAPEIDRVVLALGQMRSKQKVTTEEMMQLTELGIPSFQILADKMHMTVPALQDMLSEANGVGASKLFQKGGLDALIDGLEHGTKSFKGFGGMMAQQSTTLNGLWSTFKDNVSMTLVKIIQPALPTLKNLLTVASDALPKVIGGIQQYAGKIGDIFKGSDVGKDIMAAMAKFGRDILPEIKKSAEDVLKVIRDNREGLEKFGHMIANDVIPAVEKLAKFALISLTTGIIIVIEAVGHFVDAWNTGRVLVVGGVKTMVDLILGYLGMIVDGAAKAFGWIPGLGEKYRKASEDFHNFVNTIDAELDRLAGKTVYTYIDTIHRDIRIDSNGNVYGGSSYMRSATNITARASGGPVSPGRAYLVGENGPEIVMFGSAGTVIPNGGGGGGLTLRVAGNGDSALASFLHGLARQGILQFEMA